ncbi:rhodanese-related sulfurtransferase [Candidatus Gracilibacteria bacterium]|nr:rhodanese-related sulfurtransferase [Candidatus Gracilibacteria bacterium]
MVNPLRNTVNRELLLQQTVTEKIPRTTLSFYRYVTIEDPRKLRDELFKKWSALGVKGRIYIANEGINAQLSLPTKELDAFRAHLDISDYFKDMPFKIAVEDGISFLKLTLKVKQFIVADGLPAGTYDVNNVGTHLTPEEFHAAVDDPNTVVVDVRNHYESRIGKFEGALTPDADTFREELPLIAQMLQDKKDKKILLYCTGGIRCEKASSYLKHQGFNDVNQLHGGIIYYAHAMREKGITPKFKGRNFVFDERLSEEVTPDILTTCDQCEDKSNAYTNCSNEMCNLLFIQCAGCREKMHGACSEKCMKIALLPDNERRMLRKKQTPKSHKQFISRQRPSLK